MDSVAEREPSEHEIVGHVFGKASPILTWRPRPANGTPPIVSTVSTGASDPSIVRPSRAPTKRMVAWPVVQNVGRERGHALRALFTLVALSLLCGSALAVGIYVVLGEETALSHAKVLPTRVIAPHTDEAIIDTLTLSAPTGPAAVEAAPAPAVPLPAPPALRSAVAQPAAAAQQHRGRVPHAHHDAASPLHAARSAASPAAGTRSGHGRA